MRIRVALLLFCAGLATGCILVTGSTDGYSAVDASCDGARFDGACVVPSCLSAADCQDGRVCCVVTNALTLKTSAACQTAPCEALAAIQLCRADAECGDAGACTKQKCPVGVQSTPLQACGIIAGCTLP